MRVCGLVFSTVANHPVIAENWSLEPDPRIGPFFDTAIAILEDFEMFSRGMPLLGLLVGGWLLFALGASPVSAQETKQEDQPKPEVEEKPTPWPPPNTEKHEVKREEDQEQGLVLHTPKEWKKEELPPQSLRLGQFSIPSAEGDKEPVEVAVFSFQGLGGGGSVDANVKRYVSQFPEATKKHVVGATGHQGKYVLIDLEGNYQPPPFQQDAKPIKDARMLAAIIGIQWQGKDEKGDPKQKSAVYFVRMVGPKKTIDANEEAFRLAFGAENKSKEYPLSEE